MNHKWTAVLAAALLAGSAGGARGQEMGWEGFRAGRFELGVYAGASLTSAWFDGRTVTLDGSATGSDNGDGQGFAPGFAPAFGAIATYWLSPAFGIRAHGNYTPMRLPFASTGFFDTSPDGGPGGRGAYVMNTYFYDLGLVVRPFSMHQGPFLSGVYLFAGGGGYTVDLAGTDQALCEGTLLYHGACLSFEPSQATVAQGTGGIGMDLFWLGRGLAMFGEAAVHVYDSPVHVDDAWVGPVTALRGTSVRVADDRTAATGRLALGLKLVLGDVMPRPTRPPPNPPPPPAESQPMVPPPPIAMTQMMVCVVRGGQISSVDAQFYPGSGDTIVGGQKFAEAYPAGGAEYAADARWYIDNEPITFNGTRYVKYGLPRVLGATEVVNVGTHQGVAAFAETAGSQAMPEVIYVPVRPGCEFQPYQAEVKAGAVRG
ncbi:MAG TPA: hypothetical protein VEX86_03780 [Longimicrobium sp.]|nr:hypothetical protein [Longimicrobium sp.]